VAHALDAELADISTNGKPVCLRRSNNGELTIEGLGHTSAGCLARFDLEGRHPVLVIVGGAGVWTSLGVRRLRLYVGGCAA
jgi:hypothetical protein